MLDLQANVMAERRDRGAHVGYRPELPLDPEERQRLGVQLLSAANETTIALGAVNLSATMLHLVLTMHALMHIAVASGVDVDPLLRAALEARDDSSRAQLATRIETLLAEQRRR